MGALSGVCFFDELADLNSFRRTMFFLSLIVIVSGLWICVIANDEKAPRSIELGRKDSLPRENSAAERGGKTIHGKIKRGEASGGSGFSTASPTAVARTNPVAMTLADEVGIGKAVGGQNPPVRREVTL